MPRPSDNVTSCELMGRQGIDLVLQHIAGTIDPLAEQARLVRADGMVVDPAAARGRQPAGLREKMEAYLGEAMEKGLVLDAVIAQTEAQARALWALRENHTEAQKREGPSIKHDISVPVSKIPAFVPEGLAAMTQGAARLPAPCAFGHVGDGNLHFNCQAPAGWTKAQFMPHAEAISGAIYDLVAALRRLDLGRARHRPHQGRRARALPQPDRARHHAGSSSARSIRRTS